MSVKLLKYCGIFLILTICVTRVKSTLIHSAQRALLYDAEFCENNTQIWCRFYGNTEVYKVFIEKHLEAGTEIRVKLDSGGTVTFENNDEYPQNSVKFTERDLINNIFAFVLRRKFPKYLFYVKGKSPPHHPPYILSLKIDGEEHCHNPSRDYFARKNYVSPFWENAPDKLCGRRRINREFTQLIVSGFTAKNGNWPWHAALYRNRKRSVQYICGGTLISKFMILTAAHCATVDGIPVNPETLGIVLGKISLLTNEITSQERKVFEVIVHDGFTTKNLDNDIALLKLSTEAIFNNYVQPACLWTDTVYDQLDSYEVTGTVVGWGIDQSDSLANDLHEATIPIVSTLTCFSYDPVFYSNLLSDKKFCAGNTNGTAACNGDSGGGLLVFVIDSKNPYHRINYETGAWYVRGIVSVTIARKDSSICEPKAYTVFTDVAKYSDWMMKYMN